MQYHIGPYILTASGSILHVDNISLPAAEFKKIQ